MGGAGSPIGRTVAMVALVMLAAVALRGYLPDTTPPERSEPVSSTGAIIAVHVMLLVSLGILLVAIASTWRLRRTKRDLPEDRSADRVRLRLDRRLMLYLAGAVLVLVFFLIAASLVRVAVDEPQAAEDSTSQEDGSADGGGQPSREEPLEPQPEPSVPGSIAILSVLLLAVAGAGFAFVALRSRTSTQQPDWDVEADDRETASVSDSLARAAELGLAEMFEPGRDPRAAIIACYVAMENELASAPDAAPLASDTPSEVLARAVSHGALHSDAAAELVGLFTEARFSSHDMTEAQREAAVQLLQLVSADLRSSA